MEAVVGAMTPAGAATPAIEVVVPVYNAPADLRCCVESVLAHTHGDYSLVLIDDASPDAGVRVYFDELATRALPHLTLLRNERNLGFTGTANRGMTRSKADVVLLNSDAIVTSGWLDAIRRCAASDATIGTITPFSNNAEICSFPRLCENQLWAADADPSSVAQAIAAAAVPYYPDIPTGVGFCFFVRRALIDAIGVFDAAFGAGYGEENDFCLRAHAAGFRNVLCDDAFVLHTGGRSFEGAKEALGIRNTAILLERHPSYLDVVRDYIARDPLKSLREAALTAHDRMFGAPLGVLQVIHGGGGTESHVRALIEGTVGRMRHALAIVRGDRWRIEEHRSDGSRTFSEFGRRADEPLEDFLRMLCGAFGIDVIHLHHISGDRERFLEAMPHVGVPYGFTVHDLNFACPTITLHRADGFYCGAVTDAVECTACLKSQPAFASVDIVRWRERHAAIVAGAAFVIAPSRWAAEAFTRYFREARVTLVPHGLPLRDARKPGGTQVVLVPDDDVPTVAIVGAIGPDKGARRVERLVALASQRDERIRFVVIGYLDRQQAAWQSDDARLTVHGKYDPRELPALFDYYRVSLILFPSAGPESFSYTLSETWAAGRAVLVPPIGALAERVAGHDAGWVMTDEEWRDESAMLDRLLDLLSPYHAVAIENAGLRAARMPVATLDAMIDATARVYEAAVAAAPVASLPVDRRRIAEAFGYRPWVPPARPGAVATAEADIPSPGGLTRTAIRFRHTPVGRLLYRLMPPRAVDALKARLR
jgi:GT2 family glycosyltransferase/glycosyltransferase involved in cell wall biosynthesis